MAVLAPQSLGFGFTWNDRMLGGSHRDETASSGFTWNLGEVQGQIGFTWNREECGAPHCRVEGL